MKVRIIENHLKKFQNLSEKQQYKEFLFCLLTPQSNAQRCWAAVEELSSLPNPSLKQVISILKTKTRFHNIKAKRIMHARETFETIKPFLRHKDSLTLRNYLARQVNGYGLKEAGHFLRNVGKSNNQIAILDRHILKHLHALGLISTPKITSHKHYLEVEQIFIAYARRMHTTPDILDLYWWSKENGELFK